MADRLVVTSLWLWGPTHVHKNGGAYREIARGIREADGASLVIYDDFKGRVWIRPALEFDDGRFRKLRKDETITIAEQFEVEPLPTSKPDGN